MVNPDRGLLAAAIGGVLTLAATPAAAESARAVDTEMCFGYNLAQDDGWQRAACGGSAFGSACGGSPERSRHPGRWKMVPAGTCERVHGGMLTPPAGDRNGKTDSPTTP